MDMNDFNAQVIAEFRANNGVVGGQFAGQSVVLLTTIGAKSGLERTNPLVCREEDGRVFVFASAAGAPRDPDWYRNLVKNPQVIVERGEERYVALATTVSGGERDEVYGRQAAQFPNFAEYAAATSRVIPVVELVRTAASS